MFVRPLLGICICLMGSGAVPAQAMDCPVSEYEQVEKRVTEKRPPATLRCNCSWRRQLGFEWRQLLLSLIVIKKCEVDFPGVAEQPPRTADTNAQVGACGDDKSANENGTLFQSIRGTNLRGRGGVQLCHPGCQGQEAIVLWLSPPPRDCRASVPNHQKGWEPKPWNIVVE